MTSNTHRGRHLFKALVPVLFAAGWLVAHGSISEPDHIFYGQVSWHGDPVETGELAIHVPDWDGPVALYTLGSEQALGDQYALRVPMHSTGPRIEGTAREGDEASIYLDGELVAMTEVGARGTAQRMDLDPENLVGVAGLRIDDITVQEGAAGTTTPAVFTVELTEPLEEAVTFSWNTLDDTAVGGSSCTDGVDFISAFGSGEILPGDSETQLEVTVCGNDEPLDDRRFLVEISDASDNAQIIKPVGEAIILDGDTLPELYIHDITVAEPPVGQTAEAVFQVSLSDEWHETVTVEWSTANGSAVAGLDYVADNGTISFAPGQQSRQIPVTVLANPAAVDDRDFFVELSDPEQASLGNTPGRALIVDALQTLVHVETLTNGIGFDGMTDPVRVAVASPDGAHVYVVSRTADELVLFGRNPDSGRLTPIESVSLAEQMAEIGRQIDGIDGFSDLAISHDGGSVYTVSENDDAIASWTRETDPDAPDHGQLTLQAVHFNGEQAPTDPAPITGLDAPRALAVSPDDDNVYVAAGGGAGHVVTFSRESDGSLRFRQHLERGDSDPVGNTVRGIANAAAIAVAPDDDQVFVAGRADNAVAVFNRNLADNGRMTFETHYVNGDSGIAGMGSPNALSVSPDGSHLYVAGHASQAIAIFRRQGMQLEWIDRVVSGSDGAQGLRDLQDLVVSQDGRFLYAVSASDGSDDVSGNLVVYAREDDASADEFGRLSFEEIKRNNVAGINGLWGASGVAVSPDQAHVYVVARFDQAISVFARDLLAPLNPDIESVSHEIEAWHNDPVIEMTWSGAVDPDASGDGFGSGVAGYSVKFSEDSDAQPDESIDVAHGSDPHGLSSEPLEDGQSHWFHLRTCDNAGNCAETVSSGPYWIDATPPEGPFDLDSPTHEPGAPAIPDNVIEVTWSEAVDPGEVASGLAGYSYVFNQSQNAGPNTVIDLAPGELSAVSSTLDDGLWWFHVRAIDVAGNAGPSQSIGPFGVGDDVTPPQVFSVSSVAAPEGDEIGAGDTLSAATTQLMVRFDKPMAQDGSGSAGHIDNFRLLTGTSTNGAAACDQPAAGLIADAVYLADSQTSVLELASETGLDAGDYILVACDRLEDFNGNQLDGSGDGVPGDAHVLDFSVAWTNLVPNPNFDQPLAADNWVASPSGQVQVDPETDAGSAVTSGAARIGIDVGDPSSYVISRCVSLDADTVAGYALQARARIVDEIGDPNPVEASVSMSFFEQSGCESGLGGEFVSNSIGGDTAGAWLPISASVSPGAVAGAQSVLLALHLEFPQGEAFPIEAWFDDTQFFAFGEGELPAEPPQVLQVLSSHGAEYGDLGQPLPTEATITQIIPEFSRGLRTDPAGTGEDSANNPDNYRLFAIDGPAGSDGPDCSDEHGIALSSASYQAASSRAVVVPAGANGLPAGHYRFVVCGTIRDFDDNQLVGDTEPGTDYVLEFEVASTNFLANPNLDDTLGQWARDFDPDSGEVRWSGADLDGLLSSGSARVQHQEGMGASYELTQCMSVDAGADDVVLSAGVLVNQAFGPAPLVSAEAVFHAEADCQGDELEVLEAAEAIGHSAGQWQTLGEVQSAIHPQAQSARVTYRVTAGDGEDAPFDVWLDRLRLGVGRADIMFRNRFTPEIY